MKPQLLRVWREIDDSIDARRWNFQACVPANVEKFEQPL